MICCRLVRDQRDDTEIGTVNSDKMITLIVRAITQHIGKLLLLYFLKFIVNLGGGFYFCYLWNCYLCFAICVLLLL